MEDKKKVETGVGVLILIALVLAALRLKKPFTPRFEDADIDGDGYVSMSDFSAVVGHYGETGPPGWIKEDINRDGIVDEKDMEWIQYYWS